jgi:hypothetical protein
MKRFPITLMATGWLLYLVSYFLPSLGFRGFPAPSTYGWEMISNVFREDRGHVLDRVLWGSAVLAFNAPILMSPLAFFARQGRLWNVLPHIMLAVTLLLVALVVYEAISDSDGPCLALGGYLWCASYVPVTCGLYLNRRARLRASQA